MIDARNREPMLYMAFIAVALHALLFFAARPRNVGGIVRAMVPSTRYLVGGSGTSAVNVGEVRTVNSPVVFSLPTSMGFSRELYEQDVTTRLHTFSRPTQAEGFLNVDIVVGHGEKRLDPAALMLTASVDRAPGLPVNVSGPQKRPSARRVTIAPELMERLEGGIILPAELNREVVVPWEVRASVSIGESGFVEHVFFDEPLVSDELNSQVLRLLHGLHFKSGRAIEGSIEIYSPEASVPVQPEAVP